MVEKPQGTVYWEDIDEGYDLPQRTRIVDTTLIISGAIWASHDFMPVHHDRDFAQSKGAPDIFMNILTSNGLLASYLEQWAGPEARLRKIKVDLQVPNFPTEGNKMDMNARVTRKYKDNKDCLIELEFSGVNQLGPHITGTATMKLPSRKT